MSSSSLKAKCLHSSTLTREQPGVKVYADDFCWQWEPNQLLALAKKQRAQDVHVYMTSISNFVKMSYETISSYLLFLNIFFAFAFFCTNLCIICLDITKQIQPTEKSTNKKKSHA